MESMSVIEQGPKPTTQKLSESINTTAFIGMNPKRVYVDHQSVDLTPLGPREIHFDLDCHSPRTAPVGSRMKLSQP
jgi:hypothetical protein